MSQSGEEGEKTIRSPSINADDDVGDDDEANANQTNGDENRKSPVEEENRENGNVIIENAASEISSDDSDNGNSENKQPIDNNKSQQVPVEEEYAVPVSDDEDTTNINQAYDQFIQPQNEENSTTIPTNELDEITIAQEISNYMQVNRVNIGELQTLEEMWGLCDAISAAHSGLPDSLLKEAFNFVLETHYSYVQTNHWLRNHLDGLQRKWKKEMLSDKSTSRPTKFVSASATYSPPNITEQDEKTGNRGEEARDTEKSVEIRAQSDETTGTQTQEFSAKRKRQRKQAEKRKKALVAMMGVGQMLGHARRKFATEDGELEIDEDEYGNFKIGGMELSFENWGQLNKIKDDGVVHVVDALPRKKTKRGQQSNVAYSPTTAYAQQTTKQLGANAPQPPTFSISPTSSRPTMAEQYPTVGEVEMKNEEPKGDKSTVESAKREKDEGELSSSESDKPTSSDESSDEEGMALAKRKKTKRTTTQAVPIRAQERRKMRREDEKQQGATSAQNLQVLLRKCYDLRGRIVRKLTIQQKAMFMDLMKQSMAGTLQQNVQQQHQALTQLMSSFHQ